MLSQAVLRRLSEINRRQAKSAEATRSSRDAVTPTVAVPVKDLGPQERLSTSQLPAGIEVRNASGSHWRIDQSIVQLWPEATRFLERVSPRVEDIVHNEPNDVHADLHTFARSFPSSSLYLDLETCGFAGSMIFLIGLLIQERGELTLVQLLARHYAEEKAILHSLWEIASRHHVLLTFNGKSFDWPVVHDRSTLYHLGQDPRQMDQQEMDEPEQSSGEDVAPACSMLGRDSMRPVLAHCDLLHHSRRKWKKKLPNCKLQTLEHLVCGRRRSGDIPGRDIPAAYHDYVRSGDAWQMRSVLHHNALDLITLMQLSLRVLHP